MSEQSIPYQPVNHVFVDLENVKQIDPAVISGKNLMLYLFHGPNNMKLNIEVVERLLEYSQSVQIIRSPKSGKNALDFVLAYHLGQAVQSDPKGYFHLVSKDTGFDALVVLLESRKVKVKRHVDWSQLAFQSPVKAVPPAPAKKTAKKVAKKAEKQVATKSALSVDANKLLEALSKNPAKRPTKEKRLLAYGLSFFGNGKQDSESRAMKALEELKAAKLLDINPKGGVTYAKG